MNENYIEGHLGYCLYCHKRNKDACSKGLNEEKKGCPLKQDISESILLKKGIDTIMKESDENKINIYFKNSLNAQKNIKYLSKITSFNQNVFNVKKLSKKNLTNNYKLKI